MQENEQKVLLWNSDKVEKYLQEGRSCIKLFLAEVFQSSVSLLS